MVGMGGFNRNPNHLQHVSFLLKYLTFYSDSETSVGITLYEKTWWIQHLQAVPWRLLLTPGPFPRSSSRKKRQMNMINSVLKSCNWKGHSGSIPSFYKLGNQAPRGRLACSKTHRAGTIAHSTLPLTQVLLLTVRCQTCKTSDGTSWQIIVACHLIGG